MKLPKEKGGMPYPLIPSLTRVLRAVDSARKKASGLVYMRRNVVRAIGHALIPPISVGCSI